MSGAAGFGFSKNAEKGIVLAGGGALLKNLDDADAALLAQARLLVWLHPVHWYSMPPLLKLWLDEVFAFGWAYGPGGRALRGGVLVLVRGRRVRRTARSVTTAARPNSSSSTRNRPMPHWRALPSALHCQLRRHSGADTCSTHCILVMPAISASRPTPSCWRA